MTTVFTENNKAFDSSLVDEALYNPDDSILGLVFTNSPDDVYVYHDVPAEVYAGLNRAYSPGSYYNDYIKGRYTANLEPKHSVIRPAYNAVTVKYAVRDVNDIVVNVNLGGDIKAQIEKALETLDGEVEILGVSLNI